MDDLKNTYETVMEEIAYDRIKFTLGDKESEWYAGDFGAIQISDYKTAGVAMREALRRQIDWMQHGDSESTKPRSEKLFNIWSEGYSCTGESGRAIKHGSCKGENFSEACKNFAKLRPDFNKYFDSTKMTFWGCHLYDNEAEARKSYG